MTETEFNLIMKSLKRQQTEEEVEAHEREHDLLRGLYVNHNIAYHHYGEAGH